MGLFNEDIEEYAKDVKERTARETRAVESSELSDIQFEIKLDKGAPALVWFLVIIVLFKGSGTFVYDIYAYMNYGTPLDFSILDYVAVVLMIACLLFAILLPVAMFFMDVPSVRKEYIQCKNKIYHYSQITLIKISSMQIMSVYVGKKKIFAISRDYINYDSFLAWAKKCGIHIFREPEMKINPEKSRLTTLLIFLAIAMVVFVLFLYG